MGPASDGPPPPIGRDLPAVGDAFRFVADSGESLEGTIVGPVQRTGSFGQSVQGWAVRLTDRLPDGRNFSFEETFGLDGAIVQQSASCGEFAVASQGETFACIPHRASVMFGAAGMPGLFGAASRWHAAATSGCAPLIGNVSSSPMPRLLPWTWMGGPAEACAGLPVPVQFQANMPTVASGSRALPVFRLVAYDAGPGPVLALGAPGAAPPNRTGVPRAASGLAYHANLPFPPDEAYAEGQRLSAAFRKAASAPGAHVVGFSFAITGNLTDFATNQTADQYGAHVLVGAPGAAMKRVELTKTIWRGNGTSTVALRQTPDENQSAPIPGGAQITLDGAKTICMSATGRGEADVMAETFTQNRGFELPLWSLGQYEPRYAPGQILAISFREPDIAPDQFPVLYECMLDGETGALLSLDVHARQLPY